MKTLKFQLLIGCAIIIAGCNNKAGMTISGVYVLSFKNEYNIANDTLIIDAYNLTAKTYKIEKHSGYHLVRDGKILPKAYKRQKWMAIFDQDKQVLQETAYGRQIFFEPDHQLLSYNGRYQRIR